MRPIWAPWRSTFVSAGKCKGCIFCDAPKPNQDDEAMIFARRASIFGMMNRFPYNTGHVLIAPYRHVTAVEDLSAGEWEEMRCLMSDCISAIRGSMAPDGFNIGFNVGKTAGAGFEHIHMHIVPRWNGDTNLMPVLADTKVMPEHLEMTFAKIRDRLRSV